MKGGMNLDELRGSLERDAQKRNIVQEKTIRNLDKQIIALQTQCRDKDHTILMLQNRCKALSHGDLCPVCEYKCNCPRSVWVRF